MKSKTGREECCAKLCTHSSLVETLDEGSKKLFIFGNGVFQDRRYIAHIVGINDDIDALRKRHHMVSSGKLGMSEPTRVKAGNGGDTGSPSA